MRKGLQLLGEVPEKGHLALVKFDGVVALPPGAQLFIVPDPKRPERSVPVFLAEVTRDRLVFRCNCGRPDCTRVLDYKLRVKGHHPERPGRPAPEQKG